MNLSKNSVWKNLLFLSLVLTTTISTPAHAEEEVANYAEETLSGNWNGLRTQLHDDGYDFELNYTVNFWRNFSGGAGKGNRVLDNLSLVMDIDGEKAFSSEGTSAHIYLLNNFGGRINDLVGSNGGIDNMEVPEQAFKLYEAWIQQNFFDDKLSILAGLHDLNSEFYVTDTSGLFINPTYGIGTEMAATGDNGPSVYPYTSLGLRIALTPMQNTYLMGAIYDGVPGDLNRPRGTHIRFNDNDGALVVAEGGIKSDDWGHYGAGVWKYTAKRADQLTTTDMAHSRGFYFLAERSFYNDDTRDISSFGRLGFTGGDIEQFKNNWSVGVVLSGYVPTRPDSQIGFAVTQSTNSSKFKAANAPVDGKETQFELTYADRPLPWLTVQPDLQYTVNPGTDPMLDNAWTGGIRLSIDF